MNNLEVKCYSGYTYAESPRSFRWEGIEYGVEEIERAWQEPGEGHFQVRTGGNKSFHLWYNEMNRQWSVVEMRRQEGGKC